MKENTLGITINRPIGTVFAFTVDPKNTPLWIEGIKAEETNEWPVQVGTIYRNENLAGVWRQYKLTEFVPDKTFTLESAEGNYAVQYNFEKLGDNATNFIYREWVNEGVLDEPFTSATLQRLKEVLEA